MKIIKNIINIISYIFFLKILSLFLSAICNFSSPIVYAEELVNYANIIYNVLVIYEDKEYSRMCVFVENEKFECDMNDLLHICDVKLNIEGEKEIKYHYGYCDETNIEDFERYLNVTSGMRFTSYNEFFKKPPTEKVTFLPEIWESVYEPRFSELFTLDYVGTLDIIVDQENEHLLKLMNKQPHSDIKVPVRGVYYGYDFIRNIDDTGWQLSIAGNYSRMFTKQSFKLAYKGETDENFDVKKVKLKAFPNDATMLREPISLELLKKVGVPTVRGAFTRLYINREYYGLYFLEDTVKKTYIRDLFHQKGKNPEIGPLFRAIPSNGVYDANLNYINDNALSYPNWNSTWDCKINGTMYGSKDESFAQLINFMRLLNQTDVYLLTDNEEILHSVYDIFELDIFIRLLAMDYLLGRYHGYWRNPSNYLIYFHPALRRYVIFPIDFTSTLGYKYNENNYTYKTDYVDWRLPENPYDPLINMVMEIPYLKSLFDSTLNLIVENLFNSEILDPFIDSLKNVIEYDLKMERKKKPYHFTTSIIEEVEVKETKEQVTNKDENGFPSNSTVDTTIIIKKNTTVTLIEPHWSADQSIKNIDDSDSSIGYGIKEWIRKRSHFVKEQYPNATLVSAGSLVTRPEDPSNLYSDSLIDYFAAIFPSGRYKLLAFFIIALILIISVIFVIHVKCKKPTEMEGDEHDIRKYNDSFFHRVKTRFNFNGDDGVVNNISNSVKSGFKKVNMKARSIIYRKSRNVD